MLKNKNILLGVSGGIAAYKAIELASRLTQAGAVVKTIMTDSAREFISPINFAAITHQSVYYNQWDVQEPIAHITLSDWADFCVIAPATANIVAKAAQGIADDLLTSTLLALTTPILFVPSMNVKMYANQAVQDNLSILQKRGYFCLEPDSGSLACGYSGKGRFPDPSEIVTAIQTYLNHLQDLKGKTVLITAGATIEKIDPMRSITNASTGKMGLALARSAWLRGASVTLIHGAIGEKIPYYLSGMQALSAQEMYDAVTEAAPHQDIVVMAAAVSDYTPMVFSEHKIKKDKDLQLALVRTQDILSDLGKCKPARQILVGFAAETENIESNARDKMLRKNLDMIIANPLSVSGQDDTEVIMINARESILATGTKFAVAQMIWDQICLLLPS
jgi:phosphopantothenoylcysteine decarboxylase/phosphopantothenate--cysteine ligase